MSDHKKPAARVYLHPVSVAIWANDSGKGTFFSVTIASRYKDATGKWKNSVALNEHELLVAAKALDQAHTEIQKLRLAHGSSEQPDD